LALSADGQQIVYGAVRNGHANLYLRVEFASNFAERALPVAGMEVAGMVGLPSVAHSSSETAHLRGSAATVGNLRLWRSELACQWITFAWNLSEGWLANRSSLTIAGERRLVAQIFPRWNPLTRWMRQIEGFQKAA
jgi:hypothetical protein